MAQSMISIVNQLKSQGNKITYTKRTDGGIRITSINGVKYKASTGNAIARQLAGTTLSERRSKQLEWAGKRKRGQIKPELSKEEKSLISKAQRELRKYGTHGETLKTSTYRSYVERYGKKRAMEALRNDIRWAKGLTYSGQTDVLIDRLERAKTMLEQPEQIDKLIDRIKKLQENDKFTHSQLNQIYDAMYKFEEGNIDEAEFLNDINDILK